MHDIAHHTPSGRHDLARDGFLPTAFRAFNILLHRTPCVWIPFDRSCADLVDDSPRHPRNTINLARPDRVSHSYPIGADFSETKQEAPRENWKKLHRWIYFASVASILDCIIQLKGNLADRLGDGLIIGLLRACRVVIWLRNRQITRLMIPRGRRPLDEEDTQRPANWSIAVKGAIHPHPSVLSGKRNS